MLRAERITKSFRASNGRLVAVDGVSLAVGSGARVGLVGPSGSGKSTLAQVMAMLLAPDGGALEIDGDRVGVWGVRCPRELCHRVQLVFQAPRLAVDPRLRVGDAILEPLAASGMLPAGVAERDALLDEWAARVGLTDELLERFPHEVSEGQLQRACLARALVVRPRYLICDELSSMLDVSTQAALLEAIAAEQEQRDLGVLLITHDRVLADAWCGEIADIRELSGGNDEPYPPSGMERFALSERWNGWSRLDSMVVAARAAVAAGPLDPPHCEVTVEWDDDTTTLDSLDALDALLRAGQEPLSVDIWVAHAVEAEASLTLVYNGRWLQINGAGSDWQRARQAYDAAQVELALVYGITTFKLPKPPTDTVAETRRRLSEPKD
ncbi:MAG: ABC transporter ATP-binding protein [Solirubrobacteraceae bacterium]